MKGELRVKGLKAWSDLLNMGLLNDTEKEIIENRINRLFPEPKALTYEEIITKWWRIDFDDDISWTKVIEVRTFSTLQEANEYPYHIDGEYRRKSWFIGRESADCPPIPPEEL